MATTVWTLTLGTSFELTSLKNGTESVANFTTTKATLPGEVETKGNITVKDSGDSPKVTLKTNGEITSSSSVSAASGFYVQ